MSDFLLLDKPISWTSHDLVDALRRKLQIKRIGHAGTLDPMATGLMIMLIDKGTSRSQEFMGMDKTYRGSFRLGVTTDSWDLDSKIIEEKSIGDVSKTQIETIFSSMMGEILLNPPIFSAIRQGGQRAYTLARSNQPVVLEPRKMRIDEFQLEAFDFPEIYFKVSCSKGTYIRSLAHTVGEKLGCGATLSSLVRTRIGDLYLRDARQLQEL